MQAQQRALKHRHSRHVRYDASLNHRPRLFKGHRSDVSDVLGRLVLDAISETRI